MIELPGGSFRMGSEGPEAHPLDGEGPVRDVAVGPFAIAATAVSVAEWARFAEATGHTTDAERFGWSLVFAGELAPDHPPTRALATAPWWRAVDGATWRAPAGPGSAARDDHPVVHVSWSDAEAYCVWAGVRLPAEAEWEYAARGGLEGRVFPWGDELEPGGEHRMNVFQGEFPAHDTGADGHVGTAPVEAFAPNGFGLHQPTGNVWEWCADPFTAPSASSGPPTARVQRGGSYLCHASYCNRYRVAARVGATPDASSGNTGFRVAADQPRSSVSA